MRLASRSLFCNEHALTDTRGNRVKDYLFGIVHHLPVDDSQSVVATNPAEEIRSVYHSVTWQKELGGAGITPKFGKWKNVVSSFPLHNQASNGELLRRWSKTTTLTESDLDAIRDLFGEKVTPISLHYSTYSDPYCPRSHTTSRSSSATPSSLSSPRHGASSAGFISVRTRSLLLWQTVSGALSLSSTGRCGRRT